MEDKLTYWETFIANHVYQLAPKSHQLLIDTPNSKPLCVLVLKNDIDVSLTWKLLLEYKTYPITDMYNSKASYWYGEWIDLGSIKRFRDNNDIYERLYAAFNKGEQNDK